MLELKQTETFRKWWERLKDRKARGLIRLRLTRLALGHTGDAQPVGEGVSELRVHYGPGYRVYFQQRGKAVIVLLCGGDKGTQDRDIKAAKRVAQDTMAELADWSE